MITDVIIIGGGAAGLCAAVYLKQRSPKTTVRILEALPRVGKKLSLTGNGRCNITNKNIEISRYHGENVKFCEYALKKYNPNVCESFFESIGVPFVFEGDKGYPASFQASSVVDCLRFAAENLGVIVHTETKVTNIQISGANYKISAGNISFLARNIIIAAGLFSGGERMGCDGGIFNLLKRSGFETVKTTPSIVQVKTENTITKQLKGIKVDANVTLLENGKIKRAEFGETLFCDYGLSGPPVLQISRDISRSNGIFEISLDVVPHIKTEDLIKTLNNRVKNLSYLNIDEFFTGMLNKRLGQVILKTVGFKLNNKVSDINEAKISEIAYLMKSFSFKVIGNTGFINSQATAGGLNTRQFNSNTMMSNANKNLYAVGEILDIDGDCGGFNLQWAWSSAMCAVDSILETAV